MSDAGIQVQRQIPAAGPLVLRRADGTVPLGYMACGPHWAAAFPEDLKSADLSETQLGIAIGKPKEKAETRDGITRFWDEAVTALLPVAQPEIPVSGEGLTAGGDLASPITGEDGRMTQVDRYLAMRAKRPHAATDAAAYADLLLRQVSVILLPSDAMVSLRRQEGGGWQLELRESGRLGCLLGELDWIAPGKKDKSGKLECRPRARTTTEETGSLIALVRAIQLSQLAIGCGLEPQSGLRIAVWNSDLGDRKLVLEVRPEDRGLTLARLTRQVAKDLIQGKLSEPLERLPCRPVLVVDRGGSAQLQVSEPVKGAEPLRWYGQDGALPLRWVYSGDCATSAHYPQALPFSLVPGKTAEGFGALSVHDRGAYLDWLSGERRAEGARSDFIRLYLQGLEYRILADSAGAEETADLAGEIRALRALARGEGVLGAQMDSLLDWLGATGRCPQGPLSIEGPLTHLVSLGRVVAGRHPLTAGDLALLGEILDGDELPNPPVPAGVSAARNVILPLPQKPLTAAYRSISGLCDQPRQVFLFDTRPLPDLRSSMQLRAILADRQSIGDGG